MAKIFLILAFLAAVSLDLSSGEGQAKNVTAPSTNSSSPVPAPAAAAAVHEVNITAPANNITDPATNVTAPTSNVTAPATNVTDPATNATAHTPAVVKNTTAVVSNSSAPVNSTAAPQNSSAPVKHSEPLKVVCYYNKLSENRSDALKFVPSDVDSSLCTHVIYSYLTLDPVTLTIQNESLGVDAEKIVALKEKNVTAMLSIGGRNDPTESEKFSKMVNDGSARGNFIENAVHFIRKHKFQGLDVNWEYPSCWGGNCKAGRPADRTNFVTLLRELKSALHSYKLLLSIAVSPLESVDDKAYDVKGIASNVDFINLMTFDYNNETYTTTSIHAPFQGPVPNVVSTVEYWISKGASAHQLILGIPTFGRTFTLEKPDWNGAKSPSSIGKPTSLGQPGLAAYFEICKGLNYQLKEHEGPYAYKDDQWVSFDDIPSVTSKGAYIKKSELGGAMIWSLDTDDFHGNACEQGKYPLIKAVRSSLGLA